MNQKVNRRLAAIFAADMAGYSRLMGADEEGTLAALRALRRELIDPKIAAHGGNIVKTTGDGLLAEFTSVVDAMRCAVDIQQAIADYAAGEAPDKRIEFRIGVNLGDIIFEGDDIYGDGVNIAARIEQLAAPGGVCVSNIVRRECVGKIDGAFEDGGEVALKNIARPVHVWHWRRDKAIQQPAPAPEAVESKPSIAVLPFVNMSSDREQEFFADGMTEDIITGLSCDSRLFVTARNSTFAYKGKSPDIRTVGKELGVRYVVEGSIRPLGERLRITVQLIETATGNHVWASKLDRPKAEIFEVMDEVVDEILTALGASLGMAEAARAGRQRPENLNAWALCVQAEVLFFSRMDRSLTPQVEKLLWRATEIEPGYADAWAMLARVCGMRVVYGVTADIAKDAEEARTLIGKAMLLDPNSPVVLSHCGFAAIFAGQAAQGVDLLQRSLALNPNSGLTRASLGAAFMLRGRPAEGLAQLELFIRRSLKDPYLGFAYFHSAWCHVQLEDWASAEQAARNSITHASGFGWTYLALAIVLHAQGRDAEAQRQIRRIGEVQPGWTRQHVAAYYRHMLSDKAAERMIAQVNDVWRD